MELENIVANTVYLKAREGMLLLHQENISLILKRWQLTINSNHLTQKCLGFGIYCNIKLVQIIPTKILLYILVGKSVNEYV